uniref:Uncharacterized protein AlNc14C140G7228 n=1 Tax=Albugo laibachii Nc14 TaxID=890382 RepID=F0WL41_9STRA|nr:conserved hypothetical protein [Albugo laibachii Nc14]|eukprot:CCA22001.1 conserved hypothetical protein [Albugo laibachii Nc14]
MKRAPTSCLGRYPNHYRGFLILTCIIVLSVYNFSFFYYKLRPEPETLSVIVFHKTSPPSLGSKLQIESKSPGESVEEELRKLLDERSYDVPLHTSLLDWNNKAELYPASLMQTNWTNELPFKESLHYAKLQQLCVSEKEAIIRSITPTQMQAGRSPRDALIYKNDSSLLSVLKECPIVDVFSPRGLRDHGYCEDGIAYVRGLNTRLLPHWVFNEIFYDPASGRNLTYFEICPYNGLMFFNHYWENLHKRESWPQKKSIYLMPNIEMYELNAEHLWQSDVVLAKSVDSYRRLTKWFQQNGNPRSTAVFYTRHTTTDITTLTRASDRGVRKDFNTVRIVHTPGKSPQKSTSMISACWEQDPSMPLIEIFLAPELLSWEDFSVTAWGRSNHSNYKLHTKKLISKDFSDLLARSAFFLCPSRMEGYGHYINQAKAAGGVVLTSNAPPMNELITPASGILISVGEESSKKQILGGKYGALFGLKNAPGIEAIVKPLNICEAVSRLLFNTSAEEREMMSQEARKQYAFDTNFFLCKMRALEAFALERIVNSKLLNAN